MGFLRVYLLLLVGCGRFGFDLGGGDDDVPLDVPPGAITAFEVAPPSFTTTSTTFVDIPGGTFAVPASPGTTWLLVTSATLAEPTLTAFGVEARYLVDGVECGMGGTQGVGAGPWQHFYVFAGTDAPQTIAFQLRDTGGQTATIDQLHIVALPMPANAEPHYMSVDAVQQINASPTAPALVALPLGAMSGDYVLLVVANSSDAPALQDIYLEWVGPNSEVLLPLAQNPREPWQSIFMVKVVSVATADATVTLRAYTRTSMPIGEVRNVRAFAMRADAFASIDHILTTTSILTASSGVSVGPVLTPVGSASRFWYLASAWSEEDCVNNAVPALRRMHFAVDGTERLIEHAAGNCALQLTYGTTGLLQARPNQVWNGVSSGDGQPVSMRDSQLLVLGLP